MRKKNNVELKAFCRENNLGIGGKKKDLIERISHNFQVGATELTINKEDDSVDRTTNSRWRILQTNEDPIPLPLDKGF